MLCKHLISSDTRSWWISQTLPFAAVWQNKAVIEYFCWYLLIRQTNHILCAMHCNQVYPCEYKGKQMKSSVISASFYLAQQVFPFLSNKWEHIWKQHQLLEGRPPPWTDRVTEHSPSEQLIHTHKSIGGDWGGRHCQAQLPVRLFICPCLCLFVFLFCHHIHT